MRVLVTGGAGYIGSHVCKALYAAGMEPVVFDNLSAGHRWAVRWGGFIHADLADSDSIRCALRTHKVEAVVHLAGSTFVGESMKNPRKYFENNTRNALNLLGAMLDEGVHHLVFSSTCATYGHPKQIPLVEDHAQAPVNPYGESKLMIERLLAWFGQAYQLRHVALRYFNAAGADFDSEIGEVHDPETHLIPLAIEAAMGVRPRLEVFGTDYDTPDGTAIRDYVHVNDLAQAHVLALQYLVAGGENAALNLGSGAGYSVLDVLDSVRRISGKELPVVYSPRRAGDPPVLVASPGKARQVLGWRPQVESLDCIVESAWRWHTNPPAYVRE